MTKIKDVFAQHQLRRIGHIAKLFMIESGPVVYQHKMEYEDAWFDLCLKACPTSEDALIAWIQATPSPSLPGTELGIVFYNAERLVFGTSLDEYRAYRLRDNELLFDGFIVIEAAKARATQLMRK